MLSRDLDIVNLLEMVKYYGLMRQVFFSQDDRFFLKLQHRNMICTDESTGGNSESNILESSVKNGNVGDKSEKLSEHQK